MFHCSSGGLQTHVRRPSFFKTTSESIAYIRYMHSHLVRSTLVLILLCTGLLKAQEPRDLHDISKALISSITSAGSSPDTLYISLENYHRLIDRQPMDRDARSMYKAEVNQSYDRQRSDFNRTSEELQKIYVNEIQRGVSIEMDTLRFHEVNGTANIFEIEIYLNFVYPDGEKARATIYTMAAIVRRQWSFISPLEESFD